MPGISDLASRVKDTSTTAGSGNLTLSGSAPSGYVTFNAAFGTNVRFDYAIENSVNGEWEVGVGYLSAATTLVRETVLESSNSGSAVTFSAGTQTVWCNWNPLRARRTASRGIAQQIARGNFLP